MPFILACWIVLVAVWAVGAFRTKPTNIQETPRRRFWYRILMMAAILLLLPDVRLLPFLTPLHAPAPAIGLAADILAALGLFVAVWARVTLGGNWSGDVTFKHGHELVQSGPYRFVRHPIYTGFLLLFLATALAEGRATGYAAVFVLFISFWIKWRQEEEIMAKHFPSYAAYKKRVRALVPFIL